MIIKGREGGLDGNGIEGEGENRGLGGEKENDVRPFSIAATPASPVFLFAF